MSQQPPHGATPYGPGQPPPYGGQFGPPSVGTPPPGGGGGGRRGRRLAVVLVSALAVALAGVAAFVWLPGDDTTEADNRDQPDPADVTTPAEATLAWDLPAPGVSAEDRAVTAVGTWLVGDTVVRLMDSGLVAYGLADGEERWGLPLERSSGHADCLASRNVDDGRVAVGQGRDCEVMTVVDVEAGEEVTSFPVDLPIPSGADEAPALLGDTLAIGAGQRYGGAGYRVSDGAELWRHNAVNDPCVDVSYQVLAGTLVALHLCEDGAAGGQVRGLAEDGTELWAWAYEAEYEDEAFDVRAVVSAEPLVVLAEVGDDREERLFVVHDNHTGISHPLDYDEDRHVSPCFWRFCDAALVADGQLHLRGGTGTAVGFDLTTGQEVYEAEPVEGHEEIRPFGTLDDLVLGYQPAFGQQAGLVVTIDPATAEVAALRWLDPRTSSRETALVEGGDSQPATGWHEVRPLWDTDSRTFLLSREIFQAGAGPVPALLAYR
ncbi:PQQ-binding-like beta-propeller repeat protein [Streptomyces sp. DSM 44915]|uniref:PQQ-binding-like beta-propeller repeat protein n=1 Tax=Streptomyces chisholmiae TaxID=3075540 RepID=A0ABU2JVG5_9ACTN|nr:PQQ-binding-like beta-propeller repeat protein [Streptomyces sp. DSM 44915]MDT0268975.1 PQQ-binding-like beta-propeller repeat protein [Streptomyces sp. DSM 44915]